MDTRLRTGLFIGLITAIPAGLLTFVPIFCLCIPFIAIMSGGSVGMIIARDPRYAQQPVRDATAAGLAAGLITGLIHSIAVVILYRSPIGADAIQQLMRSSPESSPQIIWTAVGLVSFFTALIDIGLMTGGAAVSAAVVKQAINPPAPATPAPKYPPPAAFVPPTMAVSQPPPPSIPAPAPPNLPYPPPPSYYGLPDATPPPLQLPD